MVPTRILLLVLVSLMTCGVARAETPPAPADPPLGRFHLWVKSGQADFDGAAAGEWGVDREGYLGIEGYGSHAGDFYFGGEIGHVGVGSAITDDGDRIRGFDFLWVELNEKQAVRVGGGFTFDAGLGAALFYVEGKEVVTLGGPEFTDPLADIGYGTHVFVDLTWRRGRFLLGLNARYQWAFDIININYSNLRYGAHLGMAF
jgi:hypothetical protein